MQNVLTVTLVTGRLKVPPSAKGLRGDRAHASPLLATWSQDGAAACVVVLRCGCAVNDSLGNGSHRILIPVFAVFDQAPEEAGLE